MIRFPSPLNSLPQSKHLHRLVFSFFILMSAMGPPTVHILSPVEAMFLFLFIFFYKITIFMN